MLELIFQIIINHIPKNLLLLTISSAPLLFNKYLYSSVSVPLLNAMSSKSFHLAKLQPLSLSMSLVFEHITSTNIQLISSSPTEYYLPISCSSIISLLKVPSSFVNLDTERRQKEGREYSRAFSESCFRVISTVSRSNYFLRSSLS